MHTEKFKVINNSGLFAEADRSLYKNDSGEIKKDCVSRSLIDFNRSEMNFNLCPHSQYTQEEIKAKIEQITGKTMRKDAVWGSTILTMPKNYYGDRRKFFETGYEGLKFLCNLDDEDIISAWVHTDESQWHLHFYFIPHYKENDKEGIAFNKVMPRTMYQEQHKKLEEYFNKQEYFKLYPVELLNDNTLSINQIKREEKEAYIKRLEKQNKELEAKKQEFIKNEYTPIRVKKEELEHRYNLLKKLYDDMLSWIKEKLPTMHKVAEKKKSQIKTYNEANKKVEDMHLSLSKEELSKAEKLDKDLDKMWDNFVEEYIENREKVKSI